ncbi:MAG: hypothetical protein OXM61_00505, partial [Candidatus Poribacteria bacterium]|nr:hypothetical protein [Candidatus Poribacteria bacterium]
MGGFPEEIRRNTQAKTPRQRKPWGACSLTNCKHIFGFYNSVMVKKLKHLELIENVINRLAKNSFFLKGWTVIFVTALLGFAAK